MAEEIKGSAAKLEQMVSAALTSEPAQSTKELDCDCPCEMCTVGLGTHCGEAPCDVIAQSTPARETEEGQ